MTHKDMSQSGRTYFRAQRYDPFPYTDIHMPHTHTHGIQIQRQTDILTKIFFFV